MVAYSGSLVSMDFLKYPRGVIVVQDKDERIRTNSWPDEVDNSDILNEAFPLADESDSEVSAETAHALRRHGIEPTLADCVEAIIEREWKYTVALHYDSDGPYHFVAISAGTGSDWRVLSSASHAHNTEAVAQALVWAIDAMSRIRRIDSKR